MNQIRIHKWTTAIRIKPRLEETATILHIEHENISRKAVVNIFANLDSVITNNINNNQPGATKNKVSNLGERKTCSQTKWTVFLLSMNTSS